MQTKVDAELDKERDNLDYNSWDGIQKAWEIVLTTKRWHKFICCVHNEL